MVKFDSQDDPEVYNEDGDNIDFYFSTADGRLHVDTYIDDPEVSSTYIAMPREDAFTVFAWMAKELYGDDFQVPQP